MGLVIIFLLGILGFIVWIFPILKIATSNRTQGGEKAAWVLLTIFIFWFAWIFYLLLAPIKNPPKNTNIHHKSNS